MADKKVSDLPSLNGADVDPADLLYIVDSSAGAAGSKKITVGQYQLAPVSGGTANTVVYLNGSKVESSSSALTFDGTNLGIGTSSPSQKFTVAVADAVQAVNLQGATGRVRFRPYVDATNGAIIDAVNAAESAYGVMTLQASTLRLFGNNGTGATIDSSGNLGLGVTPSAWSVIKAIEIGDFRNSVFSDNGSVSVGIVSGSYYNAGWKYAVTGSAVGYYEIAGNAHRWFSAPSGTAGNAISFTQAMTLTNDTKLLIGVTGNIFPGTNRANVEVNGASQALLGLGVGGTAAGYVLHDGTDMEIVQSRNGYMRFVTNNTERARITSGGNLLVGTTSDIASDAKLVAKNSTSATVTAGFWNSATSGDNLFAGFYTEATLTVRGSISYNRAGGLVAYNTTSDYRAKDIIGPVQNPGATIDALKVYEGVMKGATQSRPMLVAHEAQAVAPYAVTGVKDEANEDGTPKFQQIDVSSLVPLLLAEIQSLRARVAALEAK